MFGVRLVTRRKYDEGDGVVVPLTGGSYGIGVIARTGRPRSGILLGYFFAETFDHIPGPGVFVGIDSSRAILIVKFSSLGLDDGSWTLVPRDWPWKRDDWPLPEFRYHDTLTGRDWRRRLDESDLTRMIHQELVSEQEAPRLPEQGLAGSRFLEQRLTRLINAVNL